MIILWQRLGNGFALFKPDKFWGKIIIMITAQQLTTLMPILQAQGFRFENSYSSRAIFTNGRNPEIYDLIIYLETPLPFAEVKSDGAPYRRLEASDFAEFETQIKLGVI